MPNSRLLPCPFQILLVEDNPGDIRLLQEAFKESGLTCTLNITRDGEQAMAYLLRQGAYAQCPRPSLILLDLNMPRMDGRELLARIKKQPEFSCIPVVILSTSTAREDIQKAYELHANCYVPKPTDLDTLIHLSKAIGGFWLNSALLPG
jgi:chemotaxis family two-component system response regulator Rcp1